MQLHVEPHCWAPRTRGWARTHEAHARVLFRSHFFSSRIIMERLPHTSVQLITLMLAPESFEGMCSIIHILSTCRRLRQLVWPIGTGTDGYNGHIIIDFMTFAQE